MEFYKRKIRALLDQRESHIRTIERALSEMKDGDCAITTATNITNAVAQIISIHAQIDAYRMAEMIDGINKDDSHKNE